PHDFIGKYLSKGVNGFNHSLAFTTGNFPEHIVITAANRRVTEATCRSCHAQVTHSIDADTQPLECIRCHSSVGHGP
ncbi:MAG: cytochrome c nitrite reductase small subunit, partial [Pseudomonadota bacterium]